LSSALIDTVEVVETRQQSTNPRR